MPRKMLKACVIAGSIMFGLPSVSFADEIGSPLCDSFDCDKVVALLEYDLHCQFKHLPEEYQTRITELLKLEDGYDGLQTVGWGVYQYKMEILTHLNDLSGGGLSDLNDLGSGENLQGLQTLNSRLQNGQLGNLGGLNNLLNH